MHPATNFRSAMHVMAVLCVLLVAACTTTPSWPDSVLTPARLNDSKHDYNSAEVTVYGWMRSGFENYALWDNQEASAKGEFARKCVSLLVPKSMDTSAFDQRYVKVTGVFLERAPSNLVQLGGCNTTTLRLKEGAPPQAVRGN